jgi:thiamine monophosphate synthase
MNLYIPVDYVLAGEIFYTTTKEERRIHKIKHLISNIKIKN